MGGKNIPRDVPPAPLVHQVHAEYGDIYDAAGSKARQVGDEVSG